MCGALCSVRGGCGRKQTHPFEKNLYFCTKARKTYMPSGKNVVQKPVQRGKKPVPSGTKAVPEGRCSAGNTEKAERNETKCFRKIKNLFISGKVKSIKSGKIKKDSRSGTAGGRRFCLELQYCDNDKNCGENYKNARQTTDRFAFLHVSMGRFRRRRNNLFSILRFQDFLFTPHDIVLFLHFCFFFGFQPFCGSPLNLIKFLLFCFFFCFISNNGALPRWS